MLGPKGRRAGGRVRQRAMVVQRKTCRPVQFELLEPARGSLFAWLERRGGAVDDFAFPSRTERDRRLSTRQYARLVDEWVTAIGLRREDYGTHSLRRAKAAIIYKQTGNLRAVQILLGHTKMRRRCDTSAWKWRMRLRWLRAPRSDERDGEPPLSVGLTFAGAASRHKWTLRLSTPVPKGGPQGLCGERDPSSAGLERQPPPSAAGDQACEMRLLGN